MGMVTVTGPDGKPYTVDTQYLHSAQEPTHNNYIAWTADGQMYQRVLDADGVARWYRLLRTDVVDFVGQIQPQIGLAGTSGADFAFTVGRDSHYMTP